MFKKSLVLGMTLALAATAIVGCGSSTKDNTTTGDKNAADKKEADPKKLTIGFVPSQQAEELNAKTKPMADLLSKELGIDCEVIVSTNFNGLVEAMAAKKVDIGFLAPVNYVQAHDQKHAADLLLQTVRNGSDHYRAQFVKKADNKDINKIEDVKGKKIAYTDPTSAAGYTYPALMLKKANIDPQKDVQPIYAGGHDKALQALLRGDVDVATTFEDARTNLTKEVPDIMSKLSVFAYSENIPNDTVSIRPQFSDEFKNKVQQAFIKIMSTPEGKKIGKEIYSFDGLVPGKDENFNSVRSAIKEMGLK